MLPLHIAVQEGASAELLALLASYDMPVSIITGNLVVEHSHSWSFLVAQDSVECSNAVALLLARTTGGYDYGKHVEALAKVGPELGQKVLQSAESGPRQAIYKHLLSRGGFEIKDVCLQPRPISLALESQPESHGCHRCCAEYGVSAARRREEQRVGGSGDGAARHAPERGQETRRGAQSLGAHPSYTRRRARLVAPPSTPCVSATYSFDRSHVDHASSTAALRSVGGYRCITRPRPRRRRRW